VASTLGASGSVGGFGPLEARDYGERDCRDEEDDHERPLERAIAAIELDAEEGLNPVTPYQRECEQNAAGYGQAEFDPETPTHVEHAG
jgi:hypothetical protein